MTDGGYNGWKNYATWGVALVLENDQGTYNHVRERAAQLVKDAPEHPNVESDIWTAEQAVRFELADFLKGFTEELCGLEGGLDGSVSEPSLMARQVMQAGLDDVDWDEIADHYIEGDR